MKVVHRARSDDHRTRDLQTETDDKISDPEHSNRKSPWKRKTSWNSPLMFQTRHTSPKTVSSSIVIIFLKKQVWSWKRRVIQIFLSNANWVIRNSYLLIFPETSWKHKTTQSTWTKPNSCSRHQSCLQNVPLSGLFGCGKMWQRRARKMFERCIDKTLWSPTRCGFSWRRILPFVSRPCPQEKHNYRLVLTCFTPWVTCFQCFPHYLISHTFWWNHLWSQSAGNPKPSTTEDFHRKGSL